MSERNEEALRSLWRELADKGIEQGVDWPSIARTLFADLDRLQRWKAEALVLFDGLQDLGRALDLPLGTLVTGPRAIEAAEQLRTERDAAREDRAQVRRDVAARIRAGKIRSLPGAPDQDWRWNNALEYAAQVAEEVRAACRLPDAEAAGPLLGEGDQA